MSTNGNANHHEQYAATGPTTTESTPQIENSQSDLPKDEIGWYFVEQYYTTLSKNPNKLHLFYGKKSQFVAGAEAEVTTVCVNRPNIQERIKQLDFEDSKVRISNVDSQGSAENILIQVIGEISSKGAEPRKFVQSFVLAKQPSGYFVLNDILRYIVDEPVEETEAAAEAPVEAPAATEAAPAVEAEAEPAAEPEVPVEEPVAEEKEPAELDTAAISQKLEEAAEEAPAPAAAEAPAPEPVVETQEPVVEEKTETQPTPEKVVEEVAEEAAAKPEEPKDPAPTPAAPATAAPVAAPAPAKPPKPQQPPKPMTWASRLAASAAAAAPKPVIPKVATPPAAAQARAPVPAQAPTTAPQSTEAAPVAPKDQGSEWQTAETKRQSRAQPAAAATQTEKEGTLAYIKFVTDKVKEADLKATLEAFGEVVYFDINRTKNCAFVEFKTPAGYNAAAAANPHTVNGENIVVEPRRPKSNAYGGAGYPARGGATGGRGSRGGYESQRSGSQGGGRGGFTGQGRGGRGGAPRGRGASQANA
ncbi:uncharacterized protein PODANS_7_7110 [Podospora anserina S mat+]|uniref:Podospora anserina S mat+ genomic DNA chromosome 7, supercontig 1 n=1 Tax=Podospora anserina (strain S / ATCC MYA-4624 / DSM 980 / FGSC 10383) TaxID=515849 RepID=B2AWG7_PODAN|nr:uncharacterized protein PODANS_7_7110 [Podospora anserina S mat+]CAP68741.1 unnamed protein product [Podospora anserina S mat+]